MSFFLVTPAGIDKIMERLGQALAGGAPPRSIYMGSILLCRKKTIIEDDSLIGDFCTCYAAYSGMGISHGLKSVHRTLFTPP